MVDLLGFVGDFGEHIKDLCQVLYVVVVLGCTEAHEVEEVFLIVQGHVESKLLEDRGKRLMRDQVDSPVL